VRIQRIAAEDAIKNSHPDAAELGDYTDAVEHMQAYLELMPSATDAQSARDQLDLWKLKSKERTPAQSK
jgi:hypothetical protein